MATGAHSGVVCNRIQMILRKVSVASDCEIFYGTEGPHPHPPLFCPTIRVPLRPILIYWTGTSER